ncbi:MAG: hypothetical protein E7509_03230 [Ruminococcus sp.]|nr:hypothetical protein [Ruminococcus sp.]
MNKNKNNTVSYRNKHYIAIAAVICIIIAQSFSLEGIWKILMYAGFAFVIGTLVGTYEEKDELTNLNLQKATEFTFFIMLGALFVSAVIVENLDRLIDVSQVAINLFYYILLGSIGVRSIIFLCLDIIPTLKSEDEEVSDYEEEIEEADDENTDSENNDVKIDIEIIKAELKEQIKLELQQEMNNKQETVSDEKAEKIVDANEEIAEKPKTKKRKVKECEEE